MNAKMPVHLLVRNLAQLEVGEYAWASSTALAVDLDRSCWIFTHTLVLPDKDSDSIAVSRAANGWEVDVGSLHTRWNITGVDVGDWRYERVIALEWDLEELK